MSLQRHETVANKTGVEPAIAHRQLLLAMSYRMLGSLADAEDATQEAYVRWLRLSGLERAEVVSPRAWLLKVVGRICLDMLTSARARRERYVGEWLPEPAPAGVWTSHGATPQSDPSDRIEVAEAVSMALLVVLETMTPAERVVFVLHDSLQFTFKEIAAVVGRSPAACRQLAASARARTHSSRRSEVSARDLKEAVRAFTAAWETGDVSRLVAVLDPKVALVVDSGGRVSAPSSVVHGATDCAQALCSVLVRQPDVQFELRSVNGAPGVRAAGADGSSLAVVSFGIDARHALDVIWVMRNPAKLVYWN
ncbi:sigma-70 family RNA polymerase sigma factor [Leucobacter albus]|uniref:Sigma-70 family RNA polymerase sigma factor n=1 Tax=Leucobacter albus TaxID=272210 RepID=A0ABW3TLZ1_9MICO